MDKFYFVVLLFTIACSAPNTTEENSSSAPDPTEQLPATLQAGLEAHGGLATWQQMRTLAYDIDKDSTTTEHQLIDLQNRKVLLSTDDYRLGFDGKEVWVLPNKAAFGSRSARFYHNLLFYFYALPFLAADPGINYESMTDTLNNEAYDAVKLTYDAGVGDAPDDEYILYFDQKTHQMEWLLYTVTYFTGEKGTKYNALNYAEWQTVNGLRIPRLLTGYTYANDSIGSKRYDRYFDNVSISSDVPDQSIFEVPAGAEIDSLKMN
ncbi:MAG: DUF6503 family protein [Bacteroidota bacterium]